MALSLFRKLLHPIHFGRAASEFAKGNYLRASELFEKSLGSDPDDDNVEYTYACIGRCHAALGDYEKAFVYLDKAYEIYRNKELNFANDYERSEYLKFMSAYKETLQKVGKPDRTRTPES